MAVASATLLACLPRVARAQSGSDTEQRATLLADSVGLEVDHSPSPSIGYVVGGAGTLLLGGSAYVLARSGSVSTGGALVLTGAALMAGGGFTSTQVDAHYSAAVLWSSLDVSMGTLALSGSDQTISGSKTPYLVASAAFYARAALRVVDAAASRPTSRAELARDYRSIWTAAQRKTVSPEDVRSILHDLEGSGPWMSPWLLHAPLLVGGAVDLAMLARSDYGSSDRAATGYLGATQLGFWLIGMAFDTSHGRTRYRHQLERTRMRVAIGPGPGLGVGVSGEF